MYFKAKTRWQAPQRQWPWVSPNGLRSSSAQYGQWNGAARSVIAPPPLTVRPVSVQPAHREPGHNSQSSSARLT